MRQRLWIGVWLVLWGTAGPAFAGIKVQWKFKEGDRFYLEEKTVRKQTTKFMGSDIDKQDMSFMRLTRFTVLKKTTTALVLEQKIEKLRVDQSNNQKSSRLLRDLEGATFKITLDDRM